MIAERGAFPLVLGGDHSCAIGTWSGVAARRQARGPLGLIWIDAHMDAHTPGHLSERRAARHAARLPAGPRRTVSGGVDGRPRAGSARNVCLVGVRSFEPDEAELLSKPRRARRSPWTRSTRRGLDEVMAEAHAIATDGTAAFGVTIDLDVIDPHEAPGVGSPVPWGLELRALAHALAAVSSDPQAGGGRDRRIQPAARQRRPHRRRRSAQLATAAAGR